MPNSAYAYLSDIFAVDPATSASWTQTDANAIAAGYNLAS
jgi:hypothetical protein